MTLCAYCAVPSFILLDNPVMHACVCVCMHVRACVHVEARGQRPMSSFMTLHLTMEAESLNQELTDLARLAVQ